MSSGVSAFVLGPSQTVWTTDIYIAVVHGASLIAGVTMAGGLLLALMWGEGKAPSDVAQAPSPAGAPTAP